MDIFPSLIAADQLNLGHEIATLDAYCAGFHLDLMDGHFAPNIGLAPITINAINRASRHPVWVHIMANNPRRWIERLEIKEKSIVTIHIETKNEISGSIFDIKEKKCLPSLAISPKTPYSEAIPFLDESINQVLIMSVEPGFYGQQFKPDVLDKIPPLVAFREQEGLSFRVALDGGIQPEMIPMLDDLGVTQVAVANSIFSHENRLEALLAFKK